MGESKLEIERHIQYWQRCLKTLLPTQYTSTDSSRMSLGFFILSALDLLGVTIPEKERADIAEWILKCQHPHGGFCGSPNHKYPDKFYVDDGHGKEQMDSANLPATYFAILSLTLVGEYDKIKRMDCFRWLRTLQREDGSFGELITKEGKIEGGRDMRYCFTATAIRWMLRGDLDGQQEEDINLEPLVDHLRAGQTYDGGISESWEHEAHAGYTYCAISSLSILHRLPNASIAAAVKPQKDDKISSKLLPGLTNLPATIRWLVSRQLEYFPPEADNQDEEVEDAPFPLQEERNSLNGTFEPPSMADLTLKDSLFVGFNGRSNKRADTCYAFWVTASLAMIHQDHLMDIVPIRRFLFDQTQHRIGGFGKCPGNPPDIYHSYLGLATLATMREPGLKEFDPVLCVSNQAKQNINNLRMNTLAPMKVSWKHGYCFPVTKHDLGFETKTPPDTMLNVPKVT